jgi:hypothetical protein
MKFISIWKPDSACATTEPSQEQMTQMGALVGELMGTGVLVDTGGVMSGGASMRVRKNGEKVTVTDGPFAESKEVVGGFAILNVKDRVEALEVTRRFVDCAGDGVSELHELAEMP